MSTNPATLRLDVISGGMDYRAWTASALQAANVPAATILAAAQSILSSRIDATAEQQRIAVLTPGSGQAMEYMELKDEATAALAAPSAATAALYPMMAASIGIDVDPSSGQPAADVLGVARAVMAQYSAWAALGAAIRATRLKAKAAIAAATSVAAACAAYDAVTWPAPAGD